MNKSLFSYRSSLFIYFYNETKPHVWIIKYKSGFKNTEKYLLVLVFLWGKNSQKST